MQIATLSNTTGALRTLLPSGQTDGHALTFGFAAQQKGTAAYTPTLKAPSSTADVFAADILKKLQAAQTASNAGALADSGAAGALQKSLADAVAYVRQQHGDAAATAVMGIVIKGVGDGKGGEDALGDALVSSLKFIDRNFGIASGDAAISRFNGALNNAVNGYFQNGHDELFYAANGTTGPGGGADAIKSTLSATLDDMTKRFGKETADAVSDILTASLEQTGVNRQGLGTALSAADAYLTGQYGEAAGLGQTPLAGQATALAKGSVLDMAV
ncbi:MAG TPA: hypothetical protein PKD41_15610 [Solidesulfovibrio sp.]|nr:hypothetical protein [Desulfovibrio sp.]HML62321.1 hypothetical protein [Solidesulfovibrio sp.]